MSRISSPPSVASAVVLALLASVAGCGRAPVAPVPVPTRPAPKVILHPGPRAPTPSPAPVLAPSAPRAAALATIDRIRAAATPPAGPLAEDARLAKSAQYHADRLARGLDRPHDNLEWRVWTYAGFPHGDCHIRNAGFGNISEGVAEGSGAIDTGTLIGALDGDAQHRADLTDPAFSLVGLGVATGSDGVTWWVVDYGVDCARH